MIAVSHFSKTHFRDTLFACRVMLVRILLSLDFPPKSTLLKSSLINSFKHQVNIFFSHTHLLFDLGPNCLQRLSVDDTNRQRITKTH